MFKQTLITLILLIVALVSFGQSVSPSLIITSIVGSSSNTDSVVIALYRKPSFIKYAPSGEIYIVDSGDFKIRKISNGQAPTVVGTGIRGDSGEGGLAINAQIGTPYALDVNSGGEVVFSDSNDKIKKILTNGILTTLVSNVAAVGVAFHPLTSEVYFCDNYANAIKKIDSKGNIVTVAGGGSFNGDGPAFSVSLKNVRHLVFNTSDGVLYFSEIHTNTIKKLSNGQITTIAGNGGSMFSGDGVLATSTSLNLPSGLAIKPGSNDLVVADTNNNRIRLISASNGFISTIAGNGVNGDGSLATNALLYYPGGVSYSPNGDLYIADTNSGRVRKVSISDGTIRSYSGGIFGDGYPANQYGVLYRPRGIAISSTGELIIADSQNLRIRKVSLNLNGIISTIAGSVNTNGVLSIALQYPQSIATRPNGDVYFSDSLLFRIFKISAIDGTVSSFVGNGATYQFTPDGAQAKDTVIGDVFGIAFNSKGELLYSSSTNNRIRKVIADGTVVTVAGIGKHGSIGGGFSGDGGLAINAGLNYPSGMIVTSSDELIFSDSGNNRIRMILTNGNIKTLIGNGKNVYSEDGKLASASSIGVCNGIAMNSIGELIFTDKQRLRKMLTDGTLTTIAGGKNYGYSGDGNLAKDALLYEPFGVVVDSNDNIYVSDKENNRIRKISCPSGSECRFSCFGISSESSQVCSSHGECTQTDTCNCQLGYYGTHCELFDCNGITKNSSQVCSYHGICQSPNNCSCQSKYYGSNCELFDCNGVAKNSSRVCSSHGTCQSPEVCVCQSGYYGPKCEWFNCNSIVRNDSMVCSSHGSCNSPNNCSCQTGYYGPNCESFNCTGIKNTELTVCSLHGTCQGPNNCSCQSGYYGTDCELFNCNGISKLSSQVCSSHGTCQSPEVCTCESGYYGSNCESFNCTGIKNTELTVCSSKGQCTAPNSCSCQSGYYGSDCELFDCNSISKHSSQVCSSHGICQSPEVCVCEFGYYGSNCEWFNCNSIIRNDSMVCSSHGSCISPNNCSCQSGYYSSDCEQFDCNGVAKNSSQVCSSHGTCQSPEVCTCESGYYGSNCEWFNCNNIIRNDSTVCSSHGLCISPEVCSCESGYYGSECEWFKCNSIASDDSMVCSSHGLCISPNICSCQPGYYGSDCELFNCNQIDSNSKQVCSLHGTCQGPNNCSCQSGYYGTDCELFNCNGISKLSSQVCSSHGICQSPEVCSCESGYSGSSCEWFTCKSIANSDSMVCSSHGSCISPNNCSCQPGYYGTDCESFNCTGIKSTELTVCSSKGQCTAPNNCSCTASAYGSNCEFRVASSNNINGTTSQFKLNNAFKTILSTPVLIICIFFALLLH